MGDSAPMTTYVGSKKKSTVDTLLQYFTDPLKQRYGPSDAEPSGSGPGGAAATNKLTAIFSSPVNRQIMTEVKGLRDSDQQSEVASIKSAATDAAAMKKKQRFKYNMLSRPDDQDQGI